jgi:cyclic pyranopterin phosphate synthase
MPTEGVHKLQHADILSFEQLHRITRLAVSLGIEKVRITGGEPLVRKGLVSFIESLATIDGLKDLVLTTNGMLLREFAADLRRAGVKRLNVSLDSLQPDTFSSLTRGGNLKKAVDGIFAADEAGFPSVKINTVVIRGVNDSEIPDFAALTLLTSHQVRFIEYMPTSIAPAWPSAYVTGEEILGRIRKVYPLEPLPNTEADGPAKIFKIPGALGTIGVITPISNHFCASCNRIRVTASGIVKGCLFDDGKVSLKPYLDRSDDELQAVLLRVLQNKPDQHPILDGKTLLTPFSMSEIGG